MASTVDPLLKQKWEQVFNRFFDINKSKTIDWNDFELIFEKIKELRGEQSAEYKIASDAMLAVWKGLLQSTKGLDMTDVCEFPCILAAFDVFPKRDEDEEAPEDAAVSLDEWNGIWKSFNPSKMPIWQWEYLKYMFFLLDSSGDKLLDLNEYVEVMGMYGLSKDEATKAFEAICKINDKKTVDYGDFVKLWNQYFQSTDKSDPGNQLFGPI